MGPRRAPSRRGSTAASSASSPSRATAGSRLAFRDGRERRRPDDPPPTVLAVEDGVLVMNGGRQTHVAPLGEAEGAAAGEGASDGGVVAPMHGRLIALSSRRARRSRPGSASRCWRR